MKHYPTTSVGQALLDALQRKQALAKAASHLPRPARWVQPVIDADGKKNEAATLIKAAHHQRKAIHHRSK